MSENRQKSTWYIEQCFKLKSLPLLQPLFPNLKEITESFGLWHAVKKYVDFDRKDPNVIFVSVGDGHKPRTAGLVACLTNWHCVAVDPQIKKRNYNIKRLTLVKYKIENICIHAKKVIIAGVHTHATYDNMTKNIYAQKRHMIVIPCCVPFPKAPIEYEDQHIHSPKNLIKVWQNI